MRINKIPCKSCPFTENGLKLHPDKLTEIQGYLISGTNHFCHQDKSNQTVCRGGRDYQLKIWFKMGIISEPTHESLIITMRRMGVEPEDHIMTH